MARSLTRPERIVVSEFGPPVVTHLGADAANEVEVAATAWRQRLGLREEPFVMTRSGSAILLQARHVTGVVRVGGVDIEVVPKFLHAEAPAWRAALWRILTVVHADTATLRLTAAEITGTMAFADLVADAFTQSFRLGTARGLPRSYVESPVDATVLRGSLDRSRLPRWLANPWRVPCVVDELSDDTDVARLLRWGARELSRAVTSARRARTLRDLTAVGVAVPSLHLHMARPPRLGPQHLALAPAIRIAQLLREGRGLEHGDADAELGGFLWRSDDVYERYVRHLCAQAAKALGLRTEKHAILLADPLTAGAPALRTTPDVVVRRADGSAVAVIDAKYKNVSAAPSADDVYQVLAGAQAAGASRAAVMFPTMQTDASVRRWRTTWSEHPIEVAALPLEILRSATPDGVRELVGRIVVYLRGHPVAASMTSARSIST